jgi:hypothetical protein
MGQQDRVFETEPDCLDRTVRTGGGEHAKRREMLALPGRADFYGASVGRARAMRILALLALPLTIVEDLLTFVPRAMDDQSARPRTVELIERVAGLRE